MSEELVVIVGDDYDFDAWDGNKWQEEMTALYNISGTMSSLNSNGDEVINFDDFNDMSEIKMATIKACADNVSNSELIQDLMSDNLDTIMGADYDYSSWTGSKWEFELLALYDIADTIKTKNTDDEYVIDLSSDLVGSEVKLATIEAVSENSKSDIIRNSMKDTIDDLLVIDNSPTLSCMPSATYSGWNDGQWEYELYVLDFISKELSNDGVVINTSTMADSLNSIEVSFFKELSLLIYGNKTAGSVKYNSYILQAQLSSAVESIMNTGLNTTDNRYRYLHPSSINSYVNYDGSLPEYDDFDPTLDSSVGLWWSNELNCLYNLLAAMYGANGSISALNSIELNAVSVATLNAIRDNIINSYVLQSSMRITIEDVMNSDVNNGSIDVTTMNTEFWSGETWKAEISAIRNIAKTVANYTGSGVLSHSYSINSSNHFKYDGTNDGVLDETLDKYYEINLNSIDLGNSLSIQTLYYATYFADSSNIIRSLLRVSIAEILGENDDDFVNIWLNKDSGVKDSFYKNRWTYEMEALFNVSSKLAKDGAIDLSGSMMNVLPISLFDEINGSFTSDGLIDGVGVLAGDHGYVANYDDGYYVYEYSSELIRSLLKDSLASNDGDVTPSTWEDEQWAYEIYAISTLSSLLATNNELSISSISFNGGIKAELLNIIPNVIAKSTFLQDKLEQVIENLVSNTLFSRNTIKTEYGNLFDLVVNYGDSDYSWRVELGTIFGIITYNDGTLSSGLVNSNGIVSISDVQSALESLNIDIIKIASIMLKDNASSNYQYNMSRIVRLNLIEPLELISSMEDVTYMNITQSDVPYITDSEAFPPFEWISNGTNKSDLDELHELFVLLGANNIDDAMIKLASVSFTSPIFGQIYNLAASSYFLRVVVRNNFGI